MNYNIYTEQGLKLKILNALVGGKVDQQYNTKIKYYTIALTKILGDEITIMSDNHEIIIQLCRSLRLREMRQYTITHTYDDNHTITTTVDLMEV